MRQGRRLSSRRVWLELLGDLYLTAFSRLSTNAAKSRLVEGEIGLVFLYLPEELGLETTLRPRGQPRLKEE